MKRFLATILTVVMALSGSVITMANDTLNIDCEVSNANVEVGDTFYVDFKIYDNPTGYNSMTTYLKYDPSVIRAVESDVEDIPSDLIIYTSSTGFNYSLFSYSSVNSRVNFVPKSGDSDYEGMADSRKTASEIGILKFANFLTQSVNTSLQNYTGTGTLLRVKFEAVGSGRSSVELYNTSGAYIVDTKTYYLDIPDVSGSVTVAGGSNVVTESTTQTTTQTTTSSSSSSNDDETQATTQSQNNNSSSSGNGSSNNGGSNTASTETTTSDSSTEVITSSAGSDTSSNVSFTDVADGMWYHDSIIKLAQVKVVNGYTDGTFKPNDNVKRADFLLMLLRGIGVDTTNTPASNFADVSASKYYYNAVGIAKEMGIASGDGTNFNPESNITRQDMMILAKKALEITTGDVITGDSSVLDQFSDKAQISAYAVDSLAAMVNAEIVNGMGDGIAPKANTTRAQAVIIISKIMDKI